MIQAGLLPILAGFPMTKPAPAALLAGLAAAGAAQPALAGEYSPFTPAPGSGSVDFNFVHINSAEGLIVDAGGERLTLNSYQLSLSYGITEAVAFDGRIAFADNDFVPQLGLPSNQDGLADSFIGLRHRLLDEFSGAPLTLTAGLTGVIRGTYDVTRIDNLGDGGSGVQAGLSAGKFLTEKLAVTAEIGGRARFNNVPEEFFYSAEAAYVFHERFSAWVGVAVANSVGGVELGSPGFATLSFPALNEDSKLWQLGGQVKLAKNWHLSGSYGRRFNGENTALGPFFRLGLSYGF